MSEQVNHIGSAPRVAPFDGTYREVLDLLEQARNFASAAPLLSDVPARPTSFGIDPVSILRLEASCEALRVTSRLTHCLAWVLIHKAIHAGELSPDAAFEPGNRLDGGPVCLAVGGEANPRLPRRLRHLLATSRTLYVRLARLDARMTLDPVHA